MIIVVVVFVYFLQVGVKMEARQNLARLGMFYGNKTSVPLVGCFGLVVRVLVQRMNLSFRWFNTDIFLSPMLIALHVK